jgi:FG-GAP repeat/Immunoglobulin domain
VSGDVVVVGSYLHSGSGQQAGAVWVFRRVAGVWTEEARLLPPDPETSQLFGWSSAVDADRVAVGSYSDDDPVGGAHAGSAYLFRHDGGVWVFEQKVTASDIEGNAQFGTSVALDGSRLIVGAPYDDEGAMDAGAAYIFERLGNVWTQAIKLAPADPAAGDRFGHTVALRGDRTLIGSYSDDQAAASAGAAYIFEHDGTGWVEIEKLTAVPPASAAIGANVSLEGNTAVIGGVGFLSVNRLTHGNWRSTARLTTGTGGVAPVIVAYEAGSLVIGDFGNTSNRGIAVAYSLVTAPVVTSDPTDQSVTPNDPAAFSVTAAPSAGLSYSWRRDGAVLVDASPYSGSAMDTLVISPASDAEEGIYDCIVSNACSRVTSRGARLCVEPDTAPTCPGDADGNGMVNFADITNTLANFGIMCR